MPLQFNPLIKWSGACFPNWDKTPRKQPIALLRTRLANYSQKNERQCNRSSKEKVNFQCKMANKKGYLFIVEFLLKSLQLGYKTPQE